MKIESKSAEETIEFAKKIAEGLKEKEVIFLIGELGSGKTTFTKALLNALGVADISVKSPTYTYIRKYQTKAGEICHIDLYRIEELDELLEMEIEELQKSSPLVIIEWADRLHNQIIQPTKTFHFKHLGGERREILST